VFVLLTDGLADGLFVLLLEAFLSTLIFFRMAVSYGGNVIVIIDSEIVQDVIVIPCLPLSLRFRGSRFRLVFVVEPRSLSTRRAILFGDLFIIAVYYCSAFSHERR
jgi:hypothetical protein